MESEQPVKYRTSFLFVTFILIIALFIGLRLVTLQSTDVSSTQLLIGIGIGIITLPFVGFLNKIAELPGYGLFTNFVLLFSTILTLTLLREVLMVTAGSLVICAGALYSWNGFISKVTVLEASSKELAFRLSFLTRIDGSKNFVIPWKDIKNIRVEPLMYRYKILGHLLVIELIDPHKHKVNKTVVVRLLMAYTEKKLGGSVSIPISDLNASVNDIFTELNKHLNKSL